MAEQVAARFARDMGCREAEWLQWLPRAVGGHPLHVVAPGRARVDLDGGALHLQWHSVAPRAIALLRIPRLHVEFAFEGVDEPARAAFMRRFDLFTQRGGG